MSTPSAPYRVAVVGTGGVGALFAARLAETVEVHCVCRSPHVDVIREAGISVTGISGATTVRVAGCSSDPSDVGVCDLVIICLKTVHLEEAALDLRPLVRPRLTRHVWVLLA
jgi:2-dehydropantoate 2-reductase